jgi:nucleoside phosphorylase
LVGYGAAVILVVAATARELEFVAGAETLVCGIGPVESALATAAALRDATPHVLLHIGIAGAQTLEPPAVVLGSEAVYADVLDASSTFPRVERVEPDGALLAEAHRLLPHAHVLPIATAGRVGGGGVCEVEAMEGFGVLRAAARAGVPALEVRAVSNAVGEQDRARWRIAEALAALAAAVPTLIAGLDA